MLNIINIIINHIYVIFVFEFSLQLVWLFILRQCHPVAQADLQVTL